MGLGSLAIFRVGNSICLGPYGVHGLLPKNFLLHVGPRGLFTTALTTSITFSICAVLRDLRVSPKAGIGLLAATSENKS